MVDFSMLVQQASAVGHDRLQCARWGAGHLFVVCDGAGGVAGAAQAADCVAEHLVGVLPTSTASTRAALVDAIHEIDRSLAARGAAGLTTALVAVIVDGTVQGASVGDSEAWLVSNTDDIVLTAAQSRKPLVGSGRCTATAFGPVALHGTLVLGSDGLFKYCPREQLLSIVRSTELDAVSGRLLRAARLPSGRLQDDFAVLVCRGM